MNPNLAEEHLQTIRLLMERAALYRRALAPIMLVTGVLGTLAAAAGLIFHLDSSLAFGGLWLGTACGVVALAFLLARRQAFKDHEPFWSPPTCRVAQALLPPLVSGLCLSGLVVSLGADFALGFPLALIWLLFYGCALHAAGFFMVRGIRWLGWLFIAGAILLMLLVRGFEWEIAPPAVHCIMGAGFGGLHLAYGVYLYFTEPKASAA
jgi:hypothetical protein